MVMQEEGVGSEALKACRLERTLIRWTSCQWMIKLYKRWVDKLALINTVGNRKISSLVYR